MFTKRRFTCAVFLLCFFASDSRGQDGPRVEVFNTPSEQENVELSSLGRWPVQVSVTEKIGFDTAVNTSAFSGNQSSWFAQTGINLNYSFGGSHTPATLELGADVSYYLELERFDPNLLLKFQVEREMSRRLRLSANVNASYGPEPVFSLSANPDSDINGTNRRSGNFLRATNSLSASYQWLSRFSTVTRYTFGLLRYDEEAIAASQNRVENRFGQQFRYLLLPVTAIIGEYRLALTSYEDSSPSTSSPTPTGRDSTTNIFLGGIEQTFSSRLSASVRAGVQFRSAEAGDRTHPYFSSNVDYVVGQKTTVNWTNQYSIEESDSTDPTATARTTFRTGLGVNHAFTQRISTTLSLYYRHEGNGENATEPNNETSSGEDSFIASLSAVYAVNRHFSVNLDYTHIAVDSGNQSSDSQSNSYSRSRYSIGGNFTF